MAIQPIDLQTMYSQLSNVSKVMSGSQQAQLTEAMQQQNNIQKNLENSAKVQQSSGEKSNAGSINQNGHRGSGYFQGKNGKNENTDDEQEAKKENSSSSPYLGKIIDITR